MDDILYVVFLVLWLVFSIYKKRAKSKQAAQGANPQGHESSTPPPPGSDLERMFEELFGEGNKKKQIELEPIESYQEAEPYQSEDVKKEENPINTYYENYSGMDVIDNDYSFQHKGLTDVSNYQMSEVGKEENRLIVFEEKEENEIKEHGILMEFDPVKAVIYSEILKRPVF